MLSNIGSPIFSISILLIINVNYIISKYLEIENKSKRCLTNLDFVQSYTPMHKFCACFFRYPSKLQEYASFLIFFYIFFLLTMYKLQKISRLNFPVLSRVCAGHIKLGVFIKIVKMRQLYCFFYSARKKATATVLLLGDRRYSPIRFVYKIASEEYLVAEISSKQFNWFKKKKENLHFSENTQQFSVYISANKYLSGPFCVQNKREDILYHLIERPLMQLI